MRPSISQSLSLLVLLLFPPFFSHADVLTKGTCNSIADVEQTCRSIAVDHDFCIEALKSHTAARSTDLHGLAVAATWLAVDHVASTESKIEELMDLEDDGDVKDGFSACLEVFSDTGDRLRDALDNMNAKLYPKAMGLLGASLNAHDYCEGVFRDVESSTSPLAKEDSNYRKLADIAMAITASVE